MTFPALRTASYIPCVGETIDSLGDSQLVYGAPVVVPAIGIAPHNTETWPGTTTLIETANLDLFLPVTTVGLKDRFTVDGDLYEVVGVQDWSQGMITFPQGTVVALRKVEG